MSSLLIEEAKWHWVITSVVYGVIRYLWMGFQSKPFYGFSADKYLRCSIEMRIPSQISIIYHPSHPISIMMFCIIGFQETLAHEWGVQIDWFLHFPASSQCVNAAHLMCEGRTRSQASRTSWQSRLLGIETCDEGLKMGLRWTKQIKLVSHVLEDTLSSYLAPIIAATDGYNGVSYRIPIYCAAVRFCPLDDLVDRLNALGASVRALYNQLKRSCSAFYGNVESWLMGYVVLHRIADFLTIVFLLQHLISLTLIMAHPNPQNENNVLPRLGSWATISGRFSNGFMHE